MRGERGEGIVSNPKHEIRNKSETQNENVQNEEVFSRESHSRCLGDAFPRRRWCCVATVLVIRVSAIGICFGFRISCFGFRFPAP